MAYEDGSRVTRTSGLVLQLLGVEVAVEVRADNGTRLGSCRELHDFTVGEVARIDDGQVDALEESDLSIVERGVTGNSTGFAVLAEAQAMISGRRQVDERAIPPYSLLAVSMLL